MWENLVRKLIHWKGNYLSYGGNLIMLKSVLSSLPIYLFSLYKALPSVIHNMEKLQRGFLWGFDCGKRKIHWVAWDRICSLVSKGDLGIRSLREMNSLL